MIQAINLSDGYKVGHYRQLPKNTSFQLNNFTFRKSRIKGVNKVVYFGMQYIIKRYLKKEFDDSFFSVDEDAAVARFARRINNYLPPNHGITFDHIRSLHKLQYMPIVIKSIPEGARINIGVPSFTVHNTKDEFVWLVSYLETLISCLIWGPSTSATIAYQYRKILNGWALKTVGNTDFVKFQGHDFSMRGMFGLEAAMMSGAGHLTSFVGTDTIPAIDFVEEYYGADSDKELVGCSVTATEHSVMCLSTGFYVWDKYAGDWTYQGEAELAVFKRLITETCASGIISIVSDTWNLWRVLTEYMVELKDVILARDGKIVIRPDSGDPSKIITGYKLWDADEKGLNADEMFNYEALKYEGKYYHSIPVICKETDPVQFEVQTDCKEMSEAESKGVVQLLWDVFGGTVTEKGYNLLDSHVGAIYGDSITLERADLICTRLADNGFASINTVFGIGSYTYQYQTRDTFGGAIKATFGKVRNDFGVEYNIEIFKDPITDDGTKKSARGFLLVNDLGVNEPVTNKFIHKYYSLTDRVSEATAGGGALELIFRDGKIIREFALSAIRARIDKSLKEEDD